MVRHGGLLHLNQKQFAEDFGPIEKDCDCHTCRTYTRAYIHMVMNKVICFSFCPPHFQFPLEYNSYLLSYPENFTRF
ncbi:unnamed protein product [Strongylus vulgaris]|uniref:tRNA-guanine(15) transglycosylase-like domain-containing protein n=1 Tax=Strongylus vulgaris TaxID=40348 RepID=A0A3P7J433_STRVU|nr:unnamed protein product [Strongylus vulgaris]